MGIHGSVRHKLSKGEGKLLVKKAMEKDLPRDILYRPKQGFNVPLKLWMRIGAEGIRPRQPRAGASCAARVVRCRVGNEITG